MVGKQNAHVGFPVWVDASSLTGQAVTQMVESLSRFADCSGLRLTRSEGRALTQWRCAEGAKASEMARLAAGGMEKSIKSVWRVYPVLCGFTRATGGFDPHSDPHKCRDHPRMGVYGRILGR